MHQQKYDDNYWVYYPLLAPQSEGSYHNYNQTLNCAAINKRHSIAHYLLIHFPLHLQLFAMISMTVLYKVENPFDSLSLESHLEWLYSFIRNALTKEILLYPYVKYAVPPLFGSQAWDYIWTSLLKDIRRSNIGLVDLCQKPRPDTIHLFVIFISHLLLDEICDHTSLERIKKVIIIKQVQFLTKLLLQFSLTNRLFFFLHRPLKLKIQISNIIYNLIMPYLIQ